MLSPRPVEGEHGEAAHRDERTAKSSGSSRPGEVPRVVDKAAILGLKVGFPRAQLGQPVHRGCPAAHCVDHEVGVELFPGRGVHTGGVRRAGDRRSAAQHPGDPHSPAHRDSRLFRRGSSDDGFDHRPPPGHESERVIASRWGSKRLSGARGLWQCHNTMTSSSRSRPSKQSRSWVARGIECAAAVAAICRSIRRGRGLRPARRITAAMVP